MTQKSNPTTEQSRRQRKAEARAEALARAKARAAAERRRRILRNGLLGTVVAAAVIGGLFTIYRSTEGGDEPAGPTAGSGQYVGSGRYVYQVGEPGPGEQVIDFTLPSTEGGEVGTADFAGKTVLTYWHEGLGCQPCWDQIRALEESEAELADAGIDEFVSITSGPVDLLAQKMSDDGLDSVSLADTDLEVSKQYQMNQFGMMGDSRDGHTFMLIGPDGEILWRADYGGAPNYTMFVPVDQMLADLEEGRVQ